MPRRARNHRDDPLASPSKTCPLDPTVHFPCPCVRVRGGHPPLPHRTRVDPRIGPGRRLPVGPVQLPDDEPGFDRRPVEALHPGHQGLDREWTSSGLRARSFRGHRRRDPDAERTGAAGDRRVAAVLLFHRSFPVGSSRVGPGDNAGGANFESVSPMQSCVKRAGAGGYRSEPDAPALRPGKLMRHGRRRHSDRSSAMSRTMSSNRRTGARSSAERRATSPVR